MSAHYDPRTLALDRGITAYQDFHEWAHLGQHRRGTLCWRLRARWAATPVLGLWANLPVEIEAAWIARREMRACRVWWEGDGREALQGLLSYVLGLTIFFQK